MLKQIISVLSVLLLLVGCASTNEYNPKEFTTANYQKNVDNAVDATDLFAPKNDESAAQLQLSPDEFASLIKGDMYFNHGDYVNAYKEYAPLANKYDNVQIIYKSIVCLGHIYSNEQTQSHLNHLIDRLIKLDPNSSLAKLFQIKIDLTNNQLDMAKADLDQLINDNPDKARAILLFLSSSLSVSYTPINYETLNEFGKYVEDEYSGRYPESLLLASIIFSNTNNQGMLAANLDQISSTYANWLIPFYWDATILLHNNHPHTIISTYKPFVEQSSDVLLQNIYIATLIQQNQPDKVLELTDELLQKDLGDKNNTLINQAIINSKLGKFDQALNNLLPVRVKNVEQMQLINAYIATLYDYLGNNQMSLKYYEKVAAEKTSLKSVADMVLINKYIATKDYTKANVLLDQMIKANKLTAKQGILYKGMTYIDAGDNTKAYEILSNYSTEYKNDPSFVYVYATAASLTKEHTKQALSLYQKYIKLKPQDSYGYNDLAYTYATQTTQYKQAKKYAEIAFKKQPLNPMILDTMGYSCYKLKDYDCAYLYTKNAYDLAPREEIAKHLQDVYIALEHPELAKQIVIKSDQKANKLLVISKLLDVMLYMQFGIK